MHTGTMLIPEDAIRLKRAYEPVASLDGVRVLLDRLWARGISKDGAHLDAWMKELGPSTELRQWFGHRPERWIGFQERYRDELTSPLRRVLLVELQAIARASTLTLVYGARDTRENEAVVVRQYLLSGEPPVERAMDSEVLLLITCAAVAAAHVDDEIPASTLQLFAAPHFTGHSLQETATALVERDDLRSTAVGWKLTSRGQQRARQLWSEDKLGAG